MMNLILRSKTTQDNQFAPIIRKAFNKLGRIHIQKGHSVIPVMMLDDSIANMKVKSVTDTHALLDHNGEPYGVLF
jgi:hypothetical protein